MYLCEMFIIGISKRERIGVIMKKRIVATITSIMLCVTTLFSAVPSYADISVQGGQQSEEAEFIGDVATKGDPDFDSDSVMHDGSDQWRWLSYPAGRILVNRGSRPKYDNKMSLKINLFVDGLKELDNLHQLQMIDGGNTHNANSISTAWYPYKLTADVDYLEKGKLNVTEYFADKDTFVRYIDANSVNGKSLKMSGEMKGLTLQEDGSIIAEEEQYYFLFRVMRLKDDTSVEEIIKPVVNGDKWSAEIPFTKNNEKVAFTMTIAVKCDDAGTDLLKSRADVVSGKKFTDSLKETKDYWDGKLSAIPCPTVWGIQGGLDAKGVTPAQHRRAFYAAWAFNYQNVIEPTMEQTSYYYPYYQVTLGKPSDYTAGLKEAPKSCAWESFFSIQQMAMVEPEIAWSAAEGFINAIDENGELTGESLPSQKAHTVWVCYEYSKDKEKLAKLYPKLKKYLQWRGENPHWKIGARVYKDEKDISFVTQWYSDVNFAIKMCRELGEYEDIAMWENLKVQMAKDSKEWFFTPQEGDGEDKVYNTYFTDSGLHYQYDRQDDVDNYIVSALYADFPEDMMNKLINHYLKLHDKTQDLVGFDFYKYGDGCHIAYGLMEQESNDARLENKWEEFTNAVMRHIIKTVEFSEECWPEKYEARGVQPTTFTASTIIDFTYLNNGMRIDLGQPVAITDGQAGLVKNSQSDIDVYTIKGTAPILPKSVSVNDKNGTALDAYVTWEKAAEADYTKGGSFTVKGKIADTNTEVTATIYVHDQTVTFNPIEIKIIKGYMPSLPESIVCTYTSNSTTQTIIPSVTWEKIDKKDFEETGVKKVKGTIDFNGQTIEASINVLEVPVIEYSVDKSDIKQYNPVKLTAKDSKGQVINTVWDIKDNGYVKKAYIDQKGNFLPLKAGKIVVTSEFPELGGAMEIEIDVKSQKVVSYAGIGKATASDQIDSARGPAQAIDEDEKTMWRSSNNNGNQWFQIELKDKVPVYGLNIVWFEGTQPSAYEIKGSEDGVTWNTIEVIKSIGTDKNDYSEVRFYENPIEVKYVRIEMKTSSNFQPGIIEFQVFATQEIKKPVQSVEISQADNTYEINAKAQELHLDAKVLPADASDSRVEWVVTDEQGNETEIADITPTGILIPKENGTVKVYAKAVDGSNITSSTKTIIIKNQDISNVAINKPATATTTGDNNVPALAVDGDRDTRWGSKAWGPQEAHFTIDLEDEHEIRSVALYFDSGAYPEDYKLQYSLDNVTWKDIKVINGNKEVNPYFSLETPVIARYIRTMSSKTTNKEWGYSIWEFEVYGKKVINTSDVANDITKIEKPEKGDSKIVFPTVPEGFDITIKATTPADVVLSDGTIKAQEKDVEVEVIFTISKDGKSTDTKPIKVVIPGIGESAAKKELKSLLNQAASLKESSYTKNSWQVYKIIYNWAEEVYSNENATDSQLSVMKSNLQTAINSLVKIVKPVVKNGWVKKVTYTYYYKNNKVVKSSWIKSGKKTYRTDKKGRKVTAKWVTVGKYKYYLKKDGNLAKSTWVTYKKNKYRVDSKGRMVKAKWVTVSKKKYYLKKDGKMAKSAWVTYKKGKYRVDKKGKMLKSRWVKVKGKSYYLNKTGKVTKTK